MANNDAKFKLNKAGIEFFLKGGGGVRAMLDSAANRAAAVAGPGMEPHVNVGSRRARASVVTATPEAMVAEARDRRLTNSLYAGRV